MFVMTKTVRRRSWRGCAFHVLLLHRLVMPCGTHSPSHRIASLLLLRRVRDAAALGTFFRVLQQVHGCNCVSFCRCSRDGGAMRAGGASQSGRGIPKGPHGQSLCAQQLGK